MAGLIVCPQCGRGTEADAAFCVSCGAPMEAGRARSGAARVIRIGRNPESDVILDYPAVTWDHAVLTIMPSGQLMVQDLRSRNGTRLNDAPKGITTVVHIHPDDTLHIGGVALPVQQILAQVVGGEIHTVMRQAATRKTAMTGTRMVFGRNPDCDRPLKHPMVSWEHAALTREGTNFYIEDLDSKNGTFVDGTAVRGKVPVRPGQEIALASYVFILDAAGEIEQRDRSNDITVEVRNLCLDVPDKGGTKRLLEGVTLTIEPTFLVALMGPSGAGKTTLLRAIVGIQPPSAGDVLYSGISLSRNFDRFRSDIGYVPQDDIMHSLLTVRQALYYTARLRLPNDYTGAQIERRIDDVLKLVDLENAKYRVIGSPEKKGISGGQRKRVNLAMELLSNPTVMMLDEPTSGLSSSDARNVVRQLRVLADQGKTVIVTIHQPGYEVYQQFTHMAMVSNHRDPSPERRQGPPRPGKLCYFGPALEAFDFFCPNTKAAPGGMRLSDEIEEGLKQKPVQYWTEKLNFARGLAAQNNVKKPAPARVRRATKDRLRQLFTLTQRLFALKRADYWQLLVALATTLVFGALVYCSGRTPASANTDTATLDYSQWVAFCKRLGTAHFLMVVGAFWFGCNNAIREMVGERAIFRRERMVNLSLFSYLGSKCLVLGILNAAQCLVMLAMVSELNLKASFAQTLGVLCLTSMVGTCVGLFISALARSNEVAIACLPLVMLPMIVLGGGITPLRDLGWVRDVADFVAPTRWAYEANLVAESQAQGKTFQGMTPAEAQAQLAAYKAQSAKHHLMETTIARRSSNEDDVAEMHFERGLRHEFPVLLAALGGFCAVFAALTFIVLRREPLG